MKLISVILNYAIAALVGFAAFVGLATLAYVNPSSLGAISNTLVYAFILLVSASVSIFFVAIVREAISFYKITNWTRKHNHQIERASFTVDSPGGWWRSAFLRPQIYLELILDDGSSKSGFVEVGKSSEQTELLRWISK